MGNKYSMKITFFKSIEKRWTIQKMVVKNPG